jgi:hypothetical protein
MGFLVQSVLRHKPPRPKVEAVIATFALHAPAFRHAPLAVSWWGCARTSEGQGRRSERCPKPNLHPSTLRQNEATEV